MSLHLPPKAIVLKAARVSDGGVHPFFFLPPLKRDRRGGSAPVTSTTILPVPDRAVKWPITATAFSASAIGVLPMLTGTSRSHCSITDASSAWVRGSHLKPGPESMRPWCGSLSRTVDEGGCTCGDPSIPLGWRDCAFLSFFFFIRALERVQVVVGQCRRVRAAARPFCISTLATNDLAAFARAESSGWRHGPQPKTAIT